MQQYSENRGIVICKCLYISIFVHNYLKVIQIIGINLCFTMRKIDFNVWVVVFSARLCTYSCIPDGPGYYVDQ